MWGPANIQWSLSNATLPSRDILGNKDTESGPIFYLQELFCLHPQTRKRLEIATHFTFTFLLAFVLPFVFFFFWHRHYKGKKAIWRGRKRIPFSFPRGNGGTNLSTKVCWLFQTFFISRRSICYSKCNQISIEFLLACGKTYS